MQPSKREQIETTLGKLEPFRDQEPGPERTTGINQVLAELAALVPPKINNSQFGLRHFFYDGDFGEITVLVTGQQFIITVNMG